MREAYTIGRRRYKSISFSNSRNDPPPRPRPLPAPSSARHMPTQYAPLPNPHTDPDVDHELEAAFDDSEDEEEHQGAQDRTWHGYHPLAREEEHAASPPSPGGPTYNFESTEFDWARPPPGSPPSPTRAFPNDYGNSNGVVPAMVPMDVERQRGGWFGRTAAAVLPTHYVERFGLAQEVPRTPVGGGSMNDGVFANVVAKPSRAVVVQEGACFITYLPEYFAAQCSGGSSTFQRHCPVR